MKQFGDCYGLIPIYNRTKNPNRLYNIIYIFIIIYYIIVYNTLFIQIQVELVKLVIINIVNTKQKLMLSPLVTEAVASWMPMS